ncbi:MAG: translational GTPase TypA [Clostridia bacterium]
MKRTDLRNIAIIAHVDHGKTTLVDAMLKQGGAFRENQHVEERVMDSNDLEKERGITILAKNTAVHYEDVKINIVDTPGHADFSGEVERVLKMVDGVLLLVDSFEGPMPQTRFVLQKALEFGHKIIVVVNKIDRPDARVPEIEDETLELFMNLNATDEQIDSPFVFCSAKAGTASTEMDVVGTDLKPLFDTILNHIDPPEVNVEEELQVLVSSIDYNEYVGRIAIGRVERGEIKVGQEVTVCDYNGDIKPYKSKVVTLYEIDSLGRNPVESSQAGDIVCLSGIENVTIGQTLCASSRVEPVEFVDISEPTVEMNFMVNDSPFAGREGKFVTTRQIRDRLMKELLKDVSLRVMETANTDTFKVSGRGEMHLSILIENMRREGYEFQVGAPRVLYKEIDGVRHEPIEHLVVDVPSDSMGSVMEKMGSRKGELVTMAPQGEDRMKIEFYIPSRGLFGYRNEFLTDTKGEGILNTVFYEYQEYKGDIPKRLTGSLVAFESGEAVTYGLYNAQERGTLFITPGTEVYEGMVVGFSPKAEDLMVNVCKRKQLTNMRASGSDDSMRLVTPRNMSIEDAMEFISDDEILEVTPESIRIRKSILDKHLRAKSRKNS